jgi:UDP-3-O-[3-hydroxymyristoyl] glucosamine N-acyltransferase
MNDIPAGETWFGYPARGSRHAMRMLAALERLPEMVQPMRRLIRDQDAKGS